MENVNKVFCKFHPEFELKVEAQGNTETDIDLFIYPCPICQEEEQYKLVKAISNKILELVQTSEGIGYAYKARYSPYR